MLSILLTLIIIGVLLYVVERFIPMDAGIKTVFRVVVLIVVLLWLLQALGLVSGLPSLRL